MTDKILSLAEILEAPDISEETVFVPEWNGSVKIRSFTKAQQQDIRKEATVDDEIDSNRLEMFMLLRGIVEPALTNDAYEQLRGKAAGPIDRVLRAILTLSGLTAEAVDEAKAAFRN